MTASPYHQGTNDKASDKALYKMEGELEVKPAHTIELEEPKLNVVEPHGQAEIVSEAEEKLTHINSSYTLNRLLPPTWICQSLCIRCWNQGFPRSHDQWGLPAD